LGERFANALRFVTQKEKCLVLANGSADAAAELVLAEGRDGSGGGVKEILGVENIVADEFEQAAMEVVRSGFADDVDDGSGLAAEFGRVGSLLDVEFFDGVDGGGDHHVVEVLVGNGDAVH